MTKNHANNDSKVQQPQDLKVVKDAKGGGLLLPAVQKVRELGGR